MAKSLGDITFIELLPDSISGDDTIRAAAAALDGCLAGVGAAIDLVSIWPRLDEIEEPLLSLLAWQLHVDLWDPEWSDTQKRRAVRGSIAWHRRKGTPAAVAEAIELAVGGEGGAREWFDYGGDPYRFKAVTTVSLDPSGSVMAKVLAAAMAAKNVRSWLDGLIVRRDLPGTFYIGGACRLSVKTLVLGLVERSMPGTVRACGVMHTAMITTITA